MYGLDDANGVKIDEPGGNTVGEEKEAEVVSSVEEYDGETFGRRGGRGVGKDDTGNASEERLL
jgi:hypothetical protein